jgi:prevent-host-death family protein
MVTNDYLVTMSRKSLGVAEFKARLSEYLRVVRKGRELTIYDRDQPIARVVPYAAADNRLTVREPVSSYGTLGDIPMPPPATLDVDAVDLLLEDRRAGR